MMYSGIITTNRAIIFSGISFLAGYGMRSYLGSMETVRARILNEKKLAKEKISEIKNGLKDITPDEIQPVEKPFNLKDSIKKATETVKTEIKKII
jgi:hypothetical protein